jgi:hypothetical protein
LPASDWRATSTSRTTAHARTGQRIGRSRADKGKEANTEDHSKETNTTKKLKRYNGFTIDINKEPHQDDSDIESPAATAGGKRSAPYRVVSSSENKKKKLELDARRLRLE